MNDVTVSMAGSEADGRVPSRSVTGQEGAAGTAAIPSVIRGACILLLIVGAVSVLFSAPVVMDPANARCHLSRAWLDNANTDKKEWNNVDTGGQKAKDLACPDA